MLSDVSGATTLEMTEVESSDLVAQLNDAARSALFWPWCLALTMALMFLSPLLFLVGAPLTLWMFSKDRVRHAASTRAPTWSRSTSTVSESASSPRR